MDLLGVDAVLGGGRDLLVLARLRVVADRQAQAECLQVVLQQRLLFGRRSFVHAVQRRVLGAGDEVGSADIGRQHGFFDQLVRLVAGTRNDLLDTAVVVADDLRLCRLEVDRATLAAFLHQRAVDLVEVKQVVNPVLAAHGLGAPRVAQDRRHFVVSEACV